MPRLIRLAKHGYSRAFTAEAAARWRVLIPGPQPVTVARLVETDPDLAFAVRRAAGADTYRFRSPGRALRSTDSADRRRVAGWLDWFARTRNPLPTPDGRDDAWVVIVPPGFTPTIDAVPTSNVHPDHPRLNPDPDAAWRLLDHPPTEADIRPLTPEDRAVLLEFRFRAEDRRKAERAAISATTRAAGPAPSPYGHGVLVDPAFDPSFDPDYDPVPGGPLAPALDPSINRRVVPEHRYDDDNSDLIPYPYVPGELSPVDTT